MQALCGPFNVEPANKSLMKVLIEKMYISYWKHTKYNLKINNCQLGLFDFCLSIGTTNLISLIRNTYLILTIYIYFQMDKGISLYLSLFHRYVG